ncbi:MAG: DNA polymerase III subunit gamma/tau [Alphaproteobacteria bacterium]|nr:DNA polymerase III subunit gamma/tau [Alphaproteobacteria bacterium]
MEISETQDQHYRVLARKYRPSTFSELIGQDALVRTLKNAIDRNRIAHAFMLTGVRGVGKTTTARIVARALNCVGPDGTGGPTTEPCGVCDNCVAIAADRHPDVMEMDAASRTGVDDIRELIEGVRYRPVSARNKIYVIDEVHMLSNNAFNALLKTLEEPPPDVRFIFATTEIRKVPVTILSRCQRFDLRRVPVTLLTDHFTKIAEKEGVAVEEDAIRLVARAADGSVRDGLSILDQAIALSIDNKLETEQVKDMLGLADRGQILDLYEMLMAGKTAEALGAFTHLDERGADPTVVIGDLLELSHAVTRHKAAPRTSTELGLGSEETARIGGWAEQLSVPVLTRAWQVLLKGLEEVQRAPDARAAAEMILIRLAHMADMPTPGDLIKQITEQGVPASAPSAPAPSTPATPTTHPAGSGGGNGGGNGGGGQTAQAYAQPRTVPQENPHPAPETTPGPTGFLEVVELFAKHREMQLRTVLRRQVRLVRMEPGLLELQPVDTVDDGTLGRIGKCLSDWTGRRWMVSLTNEAGQPSLAEQEERERVRREDEALSHPLVKAVLSHFPDASLESIRELTETVPEDVSGEPVGGDPLDPEDDPQDDPQDDRETD